MFKKLTQGEVSVKPFRARKKWNLTNDSSYLSFHVGAKTDEPFDKTESSKSSNGLYTRGVYEVIRHKYYQKQAGAYEYFGVGDLSSIDLSTFPRKDDAVIYVLKISSRLFGKRVRPGSFKIRSTTDIDPITATDDGKGNLYSEKTGQQIGNVFYSNGVAVLTKPPEQVFNLTAEDFPDDFPFDEEQSLYTAFPDYQKDSFDLLFQQFELEFESLVQHFENQISAEIQPDEFGATTNPTARKAQGEPIEALADGDFRPYVTSIGFYNDDGELIATGKLAQPVKLPESTPMTILGRFDT